MSLYIYCPRKSTSALELVQALDAKRLRTFDGLHFWDKRKRFLLKDGDSVICWGASVPELEGVRVLNSMQGPMNKFEELRKLYAAGVKVVSSSKTKAYGMDHLLLGRSNFHVGGSDLLSKDDHSDYYVYKEIFENEYCIHSFAGKSIRAGIKVIRDGFTLTDEANWRPDANLAHPWIKSFDGGWRVRYDGFASTSRLRKLAKDAVSALGLTFGAVDIGERRVDGRLLVLEVNRAPGIEGGSTASYVRAINKWLKGGADEDRGDGEGVE